MRSAGASFAACTDRTNMERSPIHVAWIALALCAGCTPDRPYVPHRELAERILEPPTLAQLPAEQKPKLPNYIDEKPNRDDQYDPAEEMPPPRSGRRLQISQVSALAEPLDRPVTPAREDPAPPIIHHASPSNELTLAAAIDLAYRNSPAIAAARARVDMAQADKEIA